jgi:alpha-galactosidase
MFSAICIILSASITTAGATQGNWTVSSDDVTLKLNVKDNQLFISAMSGPKESDQSKYSKFEWLSGESLFPFIQKIWEEKKEFELNWNFLDAKRDKKNGTLTLSFLNSNPRIILKSIWRGRHGRGPVEHWVEILNESSLPITLPLQESLSISIAPRANNATAWWIKRGGSNASTEGGVFQEPIRDGFALDLVSDCENGSSPVPWMALQVGDERGIYVGWEFSGNGRINAHAQNGQVTISTGLSPDFMTDIASGETLWIPPAFIGCYSGDLDEGSYALHRWIIEKLRPSLPREIPDPVLTYNLYLDAGGAKAKEEDVLRSAAFCRDIGFEYFMPDAMWFPETGDWRWDPQRFPNGIRPIEEFVHSNDMKLALWCAWTNGGVSEATGALSVRGAVGHPEWFRNAVGPDWRPGPFYGTQICLASPEARDWAMKKTEWLVSNHKLDYLKHDCGPIVNSCSMKGHRHYYGVDASYWDVIGYYKIQENLLAAHPSLILENCSGGGHIKDFGVIQRSHYTVTTDTLSNLPDRQSLYDSTYAFPPIMLQAYTYERNYKVPGDDPEPYLWRSAMMGAWQIDPTNTQTWTPEQKACALESAKIYKERIRPMMKDVKVHHILPRPDGTHWDGMFYWSQNLKRGILYVFRPDAQEGALNIVLKGLKAKTSYKISSQDGSVAVSTASGEFLMKSGVAVQLKNRFSSDLVYIEEH